MVSHRNRPVNSHLLCIIYSIVYYTRGKKKKYIFFRIHHIPWFYSKSSSFFYYLFMHTNLLQYYWRVTNIQRSVLSCFIPKRLTTHYTLVPGFVYKTYMNFAYVQYDTYCISDSKCSVTLIYVLFSPSKHTFTVRKCTEFFTPGRTLFETHV